MSDNLLGIDPELAAEIKRIVEANLSDAARFARLPREERERLLSELSAEELEALAYDWDFWARPLQKEPAGEDWLTWLILAGRGWGKTRTGAEWVHGQIDRKRYGRFHLVGPTAADARDIMVEGPSGILATQKPWNPVRYLPTKRKLEWESGAVALVFSADEPDRLRGEQAEAAWCDELAAWRYPEAWSQLQLGMRLGPKPRTVVTTTPRPTKLVKDLAAAPTTHVTKGITYENLDNLAPAFIAEVIREYEGTRFGRQEVYADILTDVPGAIFRQDTIDEFRVTRQDLPKRWDQIVVAVDPAISFSEASNETGIVVVGRSPARHGYVLHDASGRLRPEQWARKVVENFWRWDATYVVAEKNQGGEMVAHTINVVDPSVPVKLVSATKNKETRAEPVGTLYEKGLVHHVGVLATLEEQMTSWEPGMESPDRMDALVWGLTELLVGNARLRVAMLSENDLAGANYWRSGTEPEDQDDVARPVYY